MFRSEGWKQLLKDFQQNITNINSDEQTTDADNLHFRKGQLAILATIVNLENQMDNAHKNALEEEEKSSEEEETLAEETNE